MRQSRPISVNTQRYRRTTVEQSGQVRSPIITLWSQQKRRPSTSLGHSYGVRPIQNDKQKFAADLARSHEHIEQTVQTPHMPQGSQGGQMSRSKSQNRHVLQKGFPTTCLSEEDGARNKHFETRVSQILKYSSSKASLHSSVLETWINETLKDAEHLEIPGTIVKPAHKQPISRYKIDKLFLHSQGVPIAHVERIYRSLFVYSIGFYEMILKCVQHANNKYSILSSLWKVFQILLEYCCKSNYQMMVAKISTEHRAELDRIEETYTAEINQRNDTEKELRERLEHQSLELTDLRKKLQEQTQVSQNLQAEIDRSCKTHEEEVALRLQFESKLNGLHSLHRDLQAKYDRAVQDIYSLETLKSIQREKVEAQSAELSKLSSWKIKNEATLMFQNERIKALQVENEQRTKQVKDLEQLLTTAHMTIEQRNLELRESVNQANRALLTKQAEKSLISNLQASNKHLEASMAENTQLKEQYRSKNIELQNKLETLFRESEANKRQLVGIEELKADRDARLSALREELDLVTQKLHKTESSNASLSIENSTLTTENAKYRDETARASELLETATKMRQQLETQNQDLKHNYGELMASYKEKERLMHVFKTQYEGEQSGRYEVERELQTLVIQKQALEKQFEIQRKQMADKVHLFQQQLSAEKDNREQWIARYNQSQKAHISLHTEFIQLKGDAQEVTVKCQQNQAVINSLQECKAQLQKLLEQQQQTHTELSIQCEKLKREVVSKQDLIQQLNESNQSTLKRMKNEHEQLRQSQCQVAENLGMQYEDLRQRSAVLFAKLQVCQQEQETLQRTLMREREDKVAITGRLKQSERNTEANLKQISNLATQLEDSLADSQKLRIQIDDLDRKLKQAEVQVAQFEERTSEIQQQFDGQKQEIEKLTIANKDSTRRIKDLSQKLTAGFKIKKKTQGCLATVQVEDQETQTEFAFKDHTTENYTDVQSTAYNAAFNVFQAQRGDLSNNTDSKDTFPQINQINQYANRPNRVMSAAQDGRLKQMGNWQIDEEDQNYPNQQKINLQLGALRGNIGIDEQTAQPIGFRKQQHVRIKHSEKGEPSNDMTTSTAQEGTSNLKGCIDQLKSVYDLRKSQGSLPNYDQSAAALKSKRSQLKSAVIRTDQTRQNMIFSAQNIHQITKDSFSNVDLNAYHQPTPSHNAVATGVRSLSRQDETTKSLNLCSKLQSKQSRVQSSLGVRHQSQNEKIMSVRGNGSIRTLIRIANSRIEVDARTTY